MPGVRFQTAHYDVPAGSRLFIFSDGTYELTKKEGDLMQLDEFARLLAQPLPDGPADLDRILAYAQSVVGQPTFEDDFSILRLDFS